MADSHDELLEIADRLDGVVEQASASTISEPLDALKAAANEVGRAWGGSWLGYQANVYYENLQPPPPGAHFSQEWGLKDMYGSRLGSRGNWKEYDPEEVKAAVYESAGHPNLDRAREFNEAAAQEFEMAKSEVLSILETRMADITDAFLSRLKDEVTELEVLSPFEVAQRLSRELSP